MTRTLCGPPRARRTGLRLAAVLLGLPAGFLVAEALLRAGIALGVDTLRNPRLYAGWLEDDDQPNNHLNAEGYALLADTLGAGVRQAEGTRAPAPGRTGFTCPQVP